MREVRRSSGLLSPRGGARNRGWGLVQSDPLAAVGSTAVSIRVEVERSYSWRTSRFGRASFHVAVARSANCSSSHCGEQCVIGGSGRRAGNRLCNEAHRFDAQFHDRRLDFVLTEFPGTRLRYCGESPNNRPAAWLLKRSPPIRRGILRWRARSYAPASPPCPPPCLAAFIGSGGICARCTMDGNAAPSFSGVSVP